MCNSIFSVILILYAFPQWYHLADVYIYHLLWLIVMDIPACTLICMAAGLQGLYTNCEIFITCTTLFVLRVKYLGSVATDDLSLPLRYWCPCKSLQVQPWARSCTVCSKFRINEHAYAVRMAGSKPLRTFIFERVRERVTTTRANLRACALIL